MKKPTLLIAIYGHPESYPPTLNAIACLATDYTIKIIHRAHQQSNWAYPAGVELIADGKVLSARAQEQLSIWRKVLLFLRFCSVLWQSLWRYQPKVMLMYDALGVLSYRWVSKFIFFAPLLWYHNHDVFDPQVIRKYSLSWWAIKAESWVFPKLAMFSLPALERKNFFPMDQLRGELLFLPNYPSLRVYGKIHPPAAPAKEIRLIYQGSISEGHGLEVIIPILGLSNSYSIKLTLIGPIHPVYQKKLEDGASAANTQDCLEILPPVAYKMLPEITSQHHIGLAIHEPIGEIYATGGTASNKIYEYAACGLPVLYLNTAHYNQHLEKYNWAKGVELNPESLLKNINEIHENYTTLSDNAKNDFEKNINFEHIFKPLLSFTKKMTASKLQH